MNAETVKIYPIKKLNVHLHKNGTHEKYEVVTK